MDKMSSSVHREPSFTVDPDEKTGQPEYQDCVDWAATDTSLYHETLNIVDHENIKIVIEPPSTEEENQSTTRL